MTMNNPVLTSLISRHEEVLKHYLTDDKIAAAGLLEAIRYMLFPGGKRLRPVLVYMMGELLQVDLLCLDKMAAAIELMHCYSLVHDDLPAMDNDDLRRGKPTCHCAFDEATAILVGDGLQALSIDILLSELPSYLDPSQVIAVTRALVEACGLAGMVSGQYLDLMELPQGHIDEPRLRFIHTLKTGKLILACANMAIAAAPTVHENHFQAIREYAMHLGLVFQMQDDYLDRYAKDTHGKGRSSDAVNQKITYAQLHDQKELQDLIRRHYQLAKEKLTCFGESAQALLALTKSLEMR